jgi:hypothetical protein
MRRPNTYELIGLAVLALIVVYVLGRCAHSHGASPKTTRLTDSLAITRPTFDSTITATAKAETVYVTRATDHAQTGTWTRVRADSLHLVADSLAKAASSAEQWRAAFVVKSQEADTLRQVASHFEHAFGEERAARLEADARADAERERRQALERLNASLAHDLARASECRLLGVPCLPRVVVGLLGIGTGVGLMVAAGR